jgi:predicted dehydrogenase
LFPVTICLDYLQWPPVRNLAVIGEAGRIDCDLLESVVTLTDRLSRKIERHEFPGFSRNDMFLDELRNFISFVEGREAPRVDLVDAMRSLNIALSARQSMQEGRIVRTEYKEWMRQSQNF